MKHNCVPAQLKTVFPRARFPLSQLNLKAIASGKLLSQKWIFRVMQYCSGEKGTAKASLICLLKCNLPNLPATFKMSGCQMLLLVRWHRAFVWGRTQCRSDRETVLSIYLLGFLKKGKTYLVFGTGKNRNSAHWYQKNYTVLTCDHILNIYQYFLILRQLLIGCV